MDRQRREIRVATRIGRGVRLGAQVAILTTTLALATSGDVSTEILGATAPQASAVGVRPGEPTTRAALRNVHERLPVSFVENRGQADARVRFQARTSHYSVFLTPNAAVFSFREQPPGHGQTRRAALTMRFAGARRSARVEGMERLPGVSHFYRGNDPRKWRTDVPHYARVRYRQPWPGVDVVFREGPVEDERQLEYDFVLTPGADPAAIALEFSGMESLSLQDGELVLRTAVGQVRHRAPLAYQDLPGGRRVIGSRYARRGPKRIGFDVDAFDTRYPLVIDPKVIYSTFLGGSLGEIITDATILGREGGRQVVVTGSTTSDDFPGAEQAVEDVAAFVARVDEDQFGATTLAFVVLLDGPTEFDAGFGITSDVSGNIYVTGQAGSGFPLVDPFDHVALGGDAFVTKLDLNGKILYSTYLGGQNSDVGHAIRVEDAGRRIYVAGETQSGNFPLENPFQGCGPSWGSIDAFLTVLQPDGQSLSYSTCLGGGHADRAFGLDLDGSTAVVVGETTSKRFPTKSGSSNATPFQSELAGESDAFVVRINPDDPNQETLVSSTFVGGGGVDTAVGVAVDRQTHRAYVTGSTVSADFPLQGPFDTRMQSAEAFVFQINEEGTSLLFSSFLGGSGVDNGRDIAIDRDGAIHVVGLTDSPDFPNAGKPAGAEDAFVTKIAPDGSRVLYSLLFGGVDFDAASAVALDFSGGAYVAGQTTSADFPTTRDVLQPAFGGLDDGFVMHLAPARPDSIGTFRPSLATFFLHDADISGPADISVQFGALGDVPVAGDWNGDGVTTIGVFSNGTFLLRNSNTPGNAELVIPFGIPGDVPLAGDWDGDGVDTIGVFRNGTFLLRNSNLPGSADIVFAFGAPGDVPLAGDWDGDGIDTIGLFRFGTFLLRNSNSAGNPDRSFAFGAAVDRPVAGDWDGDGIDTVGVFIDRGRFQLRNSNTPGPADVDLFFGTAGDVPIAGDWNGGA